MSWEGERRRQKGERWHHQKVSNDDMVLAIGKIKSRKRGTRGGNGRWSPAESVNAIGDVDNSCSSDWILERGSSRHLVIGASVMKGMESCDQEVSMADG